VSFTHLIGYALVKALGDAGDEQRPTTRSTASPTGHPGARQPRPRHRHAKPDGTRQLLVPVDQGRRGMDFASSGPPTRTSSARPASGQARGETTSQGTTISLTNPGTIGTNHSVPRLMKGRAAIIGVGAMEYPAEYQGASDETLAARGQQGSSR
jgi:multifunctional 2-oxoglutarate metabolism enzyme